MTPVSLAFDEFGDGPPFILLHGLFGSARNWQNYARQLALRFHVYALDLRNHGRSPHAPTHDYESMAADVQAFIDARALSAVTLLGHSMGGKVAMTLALTRLPALKKLIVVDIAPVAYEDQHTAVIDAMQNLPLADLARRADAERLLAETVPDASIRLFLLQNLLLDAPAPRWRLNLPVLKAAMSALVGTLPMAGDATFPGMAHFIRGALSDRVLDSHLPVLSRYFPRYQLHTVAGGGHWPHAESPVEFRRCLELALAD